MTDTQGYVLGVNTAELHRLGLQHQLWSEQTHALWERGAIRPGQTVLDIGAGPGYAACDLAQLVGPTGRVIALDEAPMYLDHLRSQAEARGLTNIDVRKGDAQDVIGAGVQPGSCDAAYARWVICFVRDPGAVIAGAARALKPGGALMLSDYFNYESMTLAPKSEVFTRTIAAVARSWRDRGGDPDVMARVPELLHEHDLELRDIRVHVRVARPGQMMWAWPDSFYRNFVPELCRTGYLSEAERDAFLREWDARCANPHAFAQTPPVYDVLAIKRG
ncbi:MAG: class I SAM-dependent methyltransferase [Phycisphaerales bacterium]